MLSGPYWTLLIKKRIESDRGSASVKKMMWRRLSLMRFTMG